MPKQLTRNTVAKKRTRQEDVDSDCLFGNCLQLPAERMLLIRVWMPAMNCVLMAWDFSHGMPTETDGVKRLKQNGLHVSICSVRRGRNFKRSKFRLMSGGNFRRPSQSAGATSKHPKDASIVFNRSCYASVTGRMEEAKVRLRQAIDLNKDIRLVVPSHAICGEFITIIATETFGRNRVYACFVTGQRSRLR